MLKRAAFAVALIAQGILLALAPLHDRQVQRAGTAITLNAQMTTRHDFFHGGSIELKFVNGVLSPPGIDKLGLADGDSVYTIGHAVDGVWVATGSSEVYPANIAASDQMIRGQAYAGNVAYGFEEIYIPDSFQQAMKPRIGSARKLQVDLAVNSEGEWSFIGIRAGDLYYAK